MPPSPGYTVFGRVIGTGMSVVDSIANLPLYNIGGPFNSIPLRDMEPEQNQVFFSNLVTTETIAPIPLFPSANNQAAVVSFSVSSEHPAIATASLTGGRTLILSPLTLGSTTLTLTATDTDGNTAQTTLSITVTTAFDAFLINTGIPSDQRAPLADPDGDGLPNLLEFALGGNPLIPASAPAPVVARHPETSALTFTYRRAQPAHIAYVVETTTTLANPASWTTIGVDQGTPDTNGLTTASIPHSPGPRFLRLRVTLTP